MSDDSDDYLHNFDNAPIMFKDVGTALLIDAYKKGIADLGNWDKLEIGDTVIIQSMFLPNVKMCPPWAVEEGVVLDKIESSCKVAIETRVGINAIWIPCFAIKDHRPNKDTKCRTKFKKMAEKLALSSATPQVVTGDIDNMEPELKQFLETLYKPKEVTKEKEPDDSDRVILVDEETGEEIVVSEKVINIIMRAIEEGKLE